MLYTLSLRKSEFAKSLAAGFLLYLSLGKETQGGGAGI